MNPQPVTGTVHDHRDCVALALARADDLCASSGSRLTDLRRRVLACVWRGHEAVKAYEILEHLGSDRGTAKPPTVYRALQFLQAHGLVHRLESLNAYVGCIQPTEQHQGQFLICTRCGWVHEFRVAAVARAVRGESRRAGFRVEEQTLEVRGACARCAGDGGVR